MKSKKTFLILLLAFVLLLGGAYVLYDRLGQDAAPNQIAAQPPQENPPQDPSPEDPEEPSGNTEESEEPELSFAPDFTVYDADGNEVTLSEHLGKPVVVNFWASWCGPCKMEMPDFNEKYQELGEEVHFLMINVTDGSRETVESASAFIAEQGYVFPVFYDTTSMAAMTYGAYSLPSTYFIDAEGHAVARAVGAIDGETLQYGIDMIME